MIENVFNCNQQECPESRVSSSLNASTFTRDDRKRDVLSEHRQRYNAAHGKYTTSQETGGQQLEYRGTGRPSLRGKILMKPADLW